MQTFLNFINDNLMDLTTQDILQGKITQTNCEERAQKLSTFSMKHQQLYMVRLAERIKQIQKPYQMLSALHLMNHINRRSIHLGFLKIDMSSENQASDKESVALNSIAKYYYFFQECNKNSQNNTQLKHIFQAQLEDACNYCMTSIKKITQFLKVQFIFRFALVELVSHRLLLTLVTRAILQRFIKDLEFITAFVTNTQSLMLESKLKHPLLVNIHYIYEKLIVINSQIPKIQKFNKLIFVELQYPRYQMDAVLNKKISLAMKQRDEDVKAFRLKMMSSKNIQESQERIRQDCYLDDSSIMCSEYNEQQLLAV